MPTQSLLTRAHVRSVVPSEQVWLLKGHITNNNAPGMQDIRHGLLSGHYFWETLRIISWKAPMTSVSRRLRPRVEHPEHAEAFRRCTLRIEVPMLCVRMPIRSKD